MNEDPAQSTQHWRVKVTSHFGPVYLDATDHFLRRIWLDGEGVPADIRSSARPIDSHVPQPPRWLRELVTDLTAYLSGRHVDLGRWVARVPLADMTLFRKRTYQALLRVRRGQTCTYGELAKAVGSPRAARAVGGAMAANPWPLIVPCHRVLARGGLGGYGGGLSMKRRLLQLERTTTHLSGEDIPSGASNLG